MKMLVKSCAFAAILSLSMATITRATQIDSKDTTNNKPTESQRLIVAQKSAPVELGETTRQFYDEMIKMHMQMVNMAQNLLESQGSKMAPETRTMVQSMIDSSNAQIMKLVGERERLFRVNRIGR